MSEEIRTKEMALSETGAAKRKLSGRKLGIIGTAAAVVLALIIGISIYNSPQNRLSRQLDLGQKYLLEQNYEQAIVEFNKAIAIDPMSVDAYLGAAEAYMSMGDLESARAILERGLSVTGDDNINSKLLQIEAELEQLAAAELAAAAADELARYSELIETIYHVCGHNGYLNIFPLSKSERESAFRESAEQMEAYLSFLQEKMEILKKLYGEELYSLEYMVVVVDSNEYFTLCGIYSALNNIYLRLADLDSCLRIRQNWAAYCGRPDLDKDDNTGYSLLVQDRALSLYGLMGGMQGSLYDRYGRPTMVPYTYAPGAAHTEGVDTITYGDEYVGPLHVHTEFDNGKSYSDEAYEYDSEGRTINVRWTASSTNGDYISAYSYTGNKSYIVRQGITGGDNWVENEIFFDEYGGILN